MKKFILIIVALLCGPAQAFEITNVPDGISEYVGPINEPTPYSSIPFIVIPTIHGACTAPNGGACVGGWQLDYTIKFYNAGGDFLSSSSGDVGQQCSPSDCIFLPRNPLVDVPVGATSFVLINDLGPPPIGVGFGNFVVVVDEDFFTGGGATEVPLPASLPLFASGLGGLGLLRWRLKKTRGKSVDKQNS